MGKQYLKGQYFSFDAIVAAVIMVMAFSALLTYWYSLQYVTESRSYDLRVEGMRIAESLLSPGSPSDWETTDMLSLTPPDIRQIGLTNGFSNELSEAKIIKFRGLANGTGYLRAKNLLRSPTDFQINITQADWKYGSSPQPDFPTFIIGSDAPKNATEVAIVYRGATFNGHPAQMKVTLWRQ
ncbi:MAG: hypothetical protein NT051_00490 [Candidatus Micrarchaeota archaeon]|nr:hypothetical protein [Candidatus Micrarchaeota archaeon]